MADITFPYDSIKAVVDHFVADTVVAIDPASAVSERRPASTSATTGLVLAAGIELMFDQVRGYDAAARKVIKHAWNASPDQTGVLRGNWRP